MNPLADGGGMPLATIIAIGLGVVVGIGGYLWYAIALSKLFPRLGEEGWKGWVPILNEATILSLGGKPAWNVIFLLVPIVQIYGLCVKIVAVHRINQRFGRGAGMTVLAVLLPPAWATALVVGPLPYPEGDRLAGIRPGPIRRQTDAGAPQEYLAPPILPPSSAAPPSTPPTFAPSFAPAPDAAARPSIPSVPATAAPAPDAAARPSIPSVPATAPPAAAPAATAGLIESVPWVSGQSASGSSPEAAQPAVPADPIGPAAAAPAPPAAAPAPPAAAPAPAPPAAPPVPPAAPPVPPAAPPAPPARPVAPAPPAAPLVATESAVPAPAPAPPSAAAAGPAVVQPDFAAADTVAAPPASLRRPAPEPTFAAPVTPSVQSSEAAAAPAPQIRAMPTPLPAEPVAPLTAPAPAADDEFDATIVVSRRRGARRVLVLDDGRRFALSATSIVIGRNPDGQPGEQCLAIPDKTRTLSKTHARLVVQGDEWRLTDLHSTNGVVVVADDGAETLLDAGESVIGAGRFILGEVGMHVAEESGS